MAGHFAPLLHDVVNEQSLDTFDNGRRHRRNSSPCPEALLLELIQPDAQAAAPDRDDQRGVRPGRAFVTSGAAVDEFRAMFQCRWPKHSREGQRNTGIGV